MRNNIFAFGQLEQLARGKVDPHKSVFFEGNIVYWETGPLYAKNWKDKPYFFYTSPKREPVEWTSNFEADYNLYFNPTMPAYAADFNGRTWEEWQAAGKDKHSVWADPLFADPSRGDFTLSENSPALALGFRPIDLGDVGPRFRPGAQ
ncbi:MAG: hypothetical protein BWZ10_02681 [candidate division BRC1 bacterium ADurb.BinA364]|nr:MAG: hypothetical protein BWZ10_02681 [candidate division BRC1 bacterium ADurb.BinA364]